MKIIATWLLGMSILLLSGCSKAQQAVTSQRPFQLSGNGAAGIV